MYACCLPAGHASPECFCDVPAWRATVFGEQVSLAHARGWANADGTRDWPKRKGAIPKLEFMQNVPPPAPRLPHETMCMQQSTSTRVCRARANRSAHTRPSAWFLCFRRRAAGGAMRGSGGQEARPALQDTFGAGPGLDGDGGLSRSVGLGRSMSMADV